MKRIIMALLLTGALFTSCKKDDEKTNSEKITGTWKPVNTIYKYVTPNGSSSDTLKYETGSSFTFNSNGNYTGVSIADGDTTEESGKWSIGTDGKLMITDAGVDTIVLTINSLTAADMQLYHMESNAGATGEIWFNFKK
jgi:hypothetical protein